MSFEAVNFSPVGGFHGRDYGSIDRGVAMYSYITADVLSAVKTGGYFNTLRNSLFHGDIIFVGSNQLGDDSSVNEYTVVQVNTVPRSPGSGNVTMLPNDINAE